MSVKVFVIVLVGLAVAVGLVLFYGALRPPGDPDQAEGGVGSALGWLAPRPTLTFDDVADAPCADPATQTLQIQPGDQCAVDVPSPSQIHLCATDPGTVLVVTRGADYPEQRVDPESLSCGSPEAVPIYDRETSLTVTCAGFVPCAVRVVVPADAAAASPL